MQRAAASFLLAAALWSAAPPARAALNDPNFTEGVAFDAIVGGTSLAWAPDGTSRLFITQKSGAVLIVRDGVLVPTPFATITPVWTNSECGVLGVAFDPNFIENRLVYFFVTVSASEQQIIRYRDDESIGVEKTPIVTGLATQGNNHDGGAIAFGPDGKLYWAIGDNGVGIGTGDDLTSSAAKVSRSNRDGTAPESNPFFDGSGPNNDFVWARGFRNPFTMAFQPEGGRLWVNVVGTGYEQIFTPVAGDNAGYSTYENNQPSPFISPVISYGTNGVGLAGIVSATRMAGIATFTTNVPHGLHPGGKVTVWGSLDTTFAQVGYVGGVPSPTEFSLRQLGADATTTGGNMRSHELGGCITGGVFYDCSAANAGYRGNYFFGDFNSGKIMRTLVEGPTVRAIDIFGMQGEGGLVGMSLGPDGDLYALNHYRTAITRLRYNAFDQGLVVSPLHVYTLEDGSGAFNVRLAIAPSDSVEVSIARASGSAPLSITGDATLSFDAGNWSIPQAVFVRTPSDGNDIDDTVTLDVTSAGLAGETVAIRIIDELEAPAGGAGGEAGVGAGGEAASSGEAGRSSGGEATGGTSGARGGSAGTGGRDGGAPGEGGEGAEANESKPKSSDDGGCDCSLGRGNDGSAAALAALAWFLLRRRAGRARAPGV